MFRVVIPARHASTRLPGKPLRRIAGEPMILHVHRLAQRSGAAEVIIATDDTRQGPPTTGAIRERPYPGVRAVRPPMCWNIQSPTAPYA